MKLDLFKTSWLDLVFESRNKSYGAYELRKENSKTTLISLLIGGSIFAFVVISPKLISMLPESSNDEVFDEKITTVKLNTPKKEEIKIEEPKKIEPPKPKVDEVKFTKPRVVETEKVKEEIKTIEELKDKTIAEKDQKGDKDAQVRIDEPTANNTKVEQVVDNTVYSSAAIEVPAEYPGGVDAFRSWYQKNFKAENLQENSTGSDVSGVVIVNFVVEKDGTISDVKVPRDVGYGSKEEAIRVLRSLKTRWAPGSHNGQNVRMSFSLPVRILVPAAE